MAPLPVSTTKCRRPARMYLPRIRSCALPAVRIDLDPMGSDDTWSFTIAGPMPVLLGIAAALMLAAALAALLVLLLVRRRRRQGGTETPEKPRP